MAMELTTTALLRSRMTALPKLIVAASTLTDRYQMTVPEPVRKALGLSKRDTIHCAIQAGEAVVLTRAQPAEEANPALEPFLRLLAQDIAAHPQRLRALDAGLQQHLQELTQGLKVDLNARLSADDE
jgi:antitoxin PrlF